jgi:hypothetical protein
MPAQAQPQNAASPTQMNRAQRAAVLNSSIEMIQQVYSNQITPANQTVVNIAPRNVGLLKKFIIVISGTANNTDGANVANLSDLGLSNLLAQVVFTDLNNNTRIQTTGWHLSLLHAARFRWGVARSLLAGAIVDNGAGFGNTFGVIVAPTAFAHGTSQPFQAIYEVPICYSDEDLRGAVYMNVVNAVANLQLTLSSAPFAAAGVDSTNAVWKGAAGNISAVTITVYQVYLDQLPRGANGVPVLPTLDLATVYELKNTAFSTFVANQDNPMPYANFRDFLSTTLIYNSNPAADAGRTAGTDTNYFALQSANFTNIWKYTPVIAALKCRQLTFSDFPLGCYYFSSRRKPLSTTTYGNMELILNPITAAAGNYALVGWEDFALTNALQVGGSLSAQ